MSVQAIALIESQRQYIFMSSMFSVFCFPCLSLYSLYTYFHIISNWNKSGWKKGYKTCECEPLFANEMMFLKPSAHYIYAALWFIHSDGWSQVMRMRCNYNLWNECDRATKEWKEWGKKMGSKADWIRTNERHKHMMMKKK